MGLDCSHDAFHGAYSAFNRFRQEIARSMGGNFPPHWEYAPNGALKRDNNGDVVYDKELDPDSWYWGEGYSEDTHPGLCEFMRHSDCDGEISPEMCVKVADDLEALLPKVEALGSVAVGHIAARGGYVEVLKKFIKGCRDAAAADEALSFH
jgi:hypothetical protein